MKATVLIVGGGPAGLATAIACAHQEIPTLVCEKSHWPLDKACGEGLMPTGVALLERLGVAQKIGPERRRDLAGVRYIAGSGKVAGAAFPEGVGWGVRRTVLSAALHERATELGLVQLSAGTSARIQAVDQSGVRVRLETRAEPERKVALVVGADGLNSKVRRAAGLGLERRRFWRWGVRRHFACEPWSNTVDVHLGDGVEAYVTPVGPHEVGVAFLCTRDRLTQTPGEDRFPSLLGRFPELVGRLGQASPTSTASAIGPLQQLARAPVADGVALVGDSSGYLDAITGEGLSLAFEQAESLAAALADLRTTRLARGESAFPAYLSRAALGSYARDHRRIVRNYKRMTRLVLALSERPRLAERVVASLAGTPRLFAHLLSANMGTRHPLALPPRETARFAWRLLAGARG